MGYNRHVISVLFQSLYSHVLVIHVLRLAYWLLVATGPECTGEYGCGEKFSYLVLKVYRQGNSDDGTDHVSNSSIIFP
jgi:hypothetical protein